MNHQQYSDDDSVDGIPLSTRLLRDRKKNDKKLQNLQSKFLEDFDPEKSTRERRKLSRKNYGSNSSNRNTLYDEKGCYRLSGLNVCDCLDNNCVGCHFPCPQCSSTKCGPTCRVLRKWTYEMIEHDAKDSVIRNRNVSMK